MLEKNKSNEVWKNVRIVGLSIDQNKEVVAKHVEDKGWGDVEHFFRAKSTCSEVYGIKGVPHVMLVDKKGTIVFKGHPSTRKDLEDDLTKLASGEQLVGEGIHVLKADDDTKQADIEVGEGYSEQDHTKIMAEIDEFKKVAKGFQENEELKTACNDMQRAFCVIVYQQDFHPNKKVYQSYENFRVLVGKKENVEKLKEAFEKDVKGSFKVNN